MNRYFLLKPISVLLLLSMILAACAPVATPAPVAQPAAPKATEAPKPAETPKPVEVKYTMMFEVQKDIKLVEDAINAVLAKRGINIAVRLNSLERASFTEKMNLMMAAGEACDIVWVAPWISPTFSQLVINGSLLPLDDLLPANAAALLKDMPPAAWDVTKIGGKIYAVPNQQIWVKPFGFYFRKDIADKYGLDLAKVNKYEDLEPFLAAVKKGEPNMLPILLRDAPASIYTGETFGFDPIVTQDVQAVVRYNDKDLKVFNAFESPEFKSAIELARKWYQAGYFNKDPVASAEAAAAFKAGKFAGGIGAVIKPGGDAEFAKNWFGAPVVQKSVTVPFMTTAAASATSTAICKTSKNPDAAMQLINLFNTDAELYNLLAKGIEGKHWVWLNQEKKVIGPGPDAANYKPGRDWMVGSIFNAYYVDETQAAGDMIGETKKLNASAAASVALGFAFDPTPVKTEMANVTNVVKELGYPLINGMADPEKTLPEFQKKLKDAGMDKIVAEAQKQVDAWKATKK